MAAEPIPLRAWLRGVVNHAKRTNMEPLVSYSGLELTLVEFILGAALILFGSLVTLIFARRGAGAADEKAAARAETLQSHLTAMTERQTELQGRLAQMAEEQ